LFVIAPSTPRPRASSRATVGFSLTAGIVEQVSLHVEQSTYRAGVLLEGRYVVRVSLPISHDADGVRVRASGAAEVDLVEMTAVCVMRDCPGIDAEPDDDRLSISTGSSVRLEVAALLSPDPSVATWLGRPPARGVPLPHGDEAMRSIAGLAPPLSGR